MTHSLITSGIRFEAPLATTKQDILLLAATRYDNASRIIAHGLKQNSQHAILTAAQQMAAILPENCVLVPVPSHHGHATYTLQLANCISELCGAAVADVLGGKVRQLTYDVKRQGKSLMAFDLGFHLEAALPDGKFPILIDNVIDTGLNAMAAAGAVGHCAVLSYAMTDKLL